jgi:hypothetical protein
LRQGAALSVAFVTRWRNPGAGKKVAQALDYYSIADVALMRVVQKILAIVELYAKPRAMRRRNAGAQVMEQGFDFAPVDIAADRIMEDGAYQVDMLVAHCETPS